MRKWEALSGFNASAVYHSQARSKSAANASSCLRRDPRVTPDNSAKCSVYTHNFSSPSYDNSLTSSSFNSGTFPVGEGPDGWWDDVLIPVLLPELLSFKRLDLSASVLTAAVPQWRSMLRGWSSYIIKQCKSYSIIKSKPVLHKYRTVSSENRLGWQGERLHNHKWLIFLLFEPRFEPSLTT